MARPSGNEPYLWHLSDAATFGLDTYWNERMTIQADAKPATKYLVVLAGQAVSSANESVELTPAELLIFLSSYVILQVG